MRLYLVSNNLSDYSEAYEYLLLSYFYLRKSSELQSLAEKFEGYLLIDSGAYSVWTLGKPIEIEKYIDFCCAFRTRAREVVFINLDVIPGKPGRMPTTARELSCAIEQSQRNYHLMISAGIPVMPVFHEGEPYDLLDEWLRIIPPMGMIGIGSRSKRLSKHMCAFYDACFSRMSSRLKRGTIRPHNLGVLSARVLERWPFFSADAKTALIKAAMGEILHLKDGKLHKKHYQEYDKLALEHSACIDRPDNVGRVIKRRGQRVAANILVLKQYNRYLDDLWRARGVVWQP